MDHPKEGTIIKWGNFNYMLCNVNSVIERIDLLCVKAPGDQEIRDQWHHRAYNMRSVTNAIFSGQAKIISVARPVKMDCKIHGSWIAIPDEGPFTCRWCE
jgi:hypothetical protein